MHVKPILLRAACWQGPLKLRFECEGGGVIPAVGCSKGRLRQSIGASVVGAAFWENANGFFGFPVGGTAEITMVRYHPGAVPARAPPGRHAFNQKSAEKKDEKNTNSNNNNNNSNNNSNDNNNNINNNNNANNNTNNDLNFGDDPLDLAHPQH